MLDRVSVPSFLTSLLSWDCKCDYGWWCLPPVVKTHSASTNCGQEGMGIVRGHSLIHRSVAKKQVPAGPEMSLSLRVHFPKLGLMLDGMG